MRNLPTNTSFYADFQSLSTLKTQAKAEQPEALKKAAQEFESVFISMMLKSMREATSSVSSGQMDDSNEMDLYQGMFDQQISTQMSKGKGLGLADLLVRQLANSYGDASTAPANATRASSTVSAASPSEFVQSVLPHAQLAAQRLGVDPTLLVAQAALETGWGKHVPANAQGSSFNLFGIKAGASWQGERTTHLTTEYVDGVAQSEAAAFRRYDSMAASFADYTSVLSQPRYAGVRNAGDDGDQFASALQASGYATDPDYAAKLTRVIANVRELLATRESPNAAQRAVPTDGAA